MTVFLGGCRIVECYWTSSSSLAVRFETSYDDKLYQVYYGREKVGASSSPGQRTIQCALKPATWPDHLTLIAVDPLDVNDSFGSLLPPRPYNRERLQITASGWPADTATIEVTSGTVPGGAVDANNLIGIREFTGDGVYTVITPEFAGSGAWNLEITGRDNTQPTGNLGSPSALSVNVLAHPPDVVSGSSGKRFTTEISGGDLMVSFVKASS